jgi:hypothetical protein
MTTSTSPIIQTDRTLRIDARTRVLLALMIFGLLLFVAGFGMFAAPLLGLAFPPDWQRRGFAISLIVSGAVATLRHLRALQDSQAVVVIGPKGLSINTFDCKLANIAWPDIVKFEARKFGHRPYISVGLRDPRKYHVQTGWLRELLRRLDVRVTGSAVRINPLGVAMPFDELLRTLRAYRERYGLPEQSS